MGVWGRSASEKALSQQIAMLSRQVQRLQEMVERMAIQQGIEPAAEPDHWGQAAEPSTTHYSSQGVDAEVLMLVQLGKRIQAIKLVRERTGLGLKEAKDVVDRL